MGGRMRRLAIILTLLALIAAACGDDSDTDETAAEPAAPSEPAEEAPAPAEPEPAEEPAPEPEPTEAPAEEMPDEEPAAAPDPMAVDLSGVCPDPLVLQTDWYPSPEHGYAYYLIGDAGELDAEAGIYTGPLLNTGINLEIRAGGPYLGFQPMTTTMQLDDNIHLGWANTDEQVAAFEEVPTIAVAAPFEINPQILMWNPEELSFSSFEEIGESGVTVFHFGGALYVDYMVGAGILNADQLDPSYDGTPARFVAANGNYAQQGFASSEPWFYENALEEWGKPVDYMLVHDSGFEIYAQPMVIRAGALEELRPCLELVVPIFQQAVLDHYANHAPTSQLILDIVEEIASSWVLHPGQMDYSAATALELGLVGNGPDDIVGNIDEARMERVVQLLKDVVDGVPEDLEATDLYTNEFIDPSIGF